MEYCTKTDRSGMSPWLANWAQLKSMLSETATVVTCDLKASAHGSV